MVSVVVVLEFLIASFGEFDVYIAVRLAFGTIEVRDSNPWRVALPVASGLHKSTTPPTPTGWGACL